VAVNPENSTVAWTPPIVAVTFAVVWKTTLVGAAPIR
jgi:hypothetical protein